MTLPESEPALYRPAVGIMLLNGARQVFVGRRIDMPAGLAAWQMPQGGIDPGETPREAALRELQEEVGTDKAEILGESRGLAALRPAAGDRRRRCGAGATAASGRNGSRCALPGEDADIDPAATEHPEFDAWEWVSPERLPELIVPFKRQLYLDVLAEFRDHCGRSLLTAVIRQARGGGLDRGAVGHRGLRAGREAGEPRGGAGLAQRRGEREAAGRAPPPAPRQRCRRRRSYRQARSPAPECRSARHRRGRRSIPRRPLVTTSACRNRRARPAGSAPSVAASPSLATRTSISGEERRSRSARPARGSGSCGRRPRGRGESAPSSRAAGTSIWQTTIVSGPSAAFGNAGRSGLAIGARRHRDQVLAIGADHDRRAAGRPIDPPHQAEIDPVAAQDSQRQGRRRNRCRRRRPS